MSRPAFAVAEFSSVVLRRGLLRRTRQGDEDHKEQGGGNTMAIHRCSPKQAAIHLNGSGVRLSATRDPPRRLKEHKAKTKELCVPLSSSRLRGRYGFARRFENRSR